MFFIPEVASYHLSLRSEQVTASHPAAACYPVTPFRQDMHQVSPVQRIPPYKILL